MKHYFDETIIRLLRTKGIKAESCVSCWGEWEDGYGDYLDMDLGKNRIALLTCSVASALSEYQQSLTKPKG